MNRQIDDAVLLGADQFLAVQNEDRGRAEILDEEFRHAAGLGDRPGDRLLPVHHPVTLPMLGDTLAGLAACCVDRNPQTALAIRRMSVGFRFCVEAEDGAHRV